MGTPRVVKELGGWGGVTLIILAALNLLAYLGLPREYFLYFFILSLGIGIGILFMMKVHTTSEVPPSTPPPEPDPEPEEESDKESKTGTLPLGTPPTLKKKVEDPYSIIRSDDLVKTPESVARDRSVCPEGPYVVEGGKARHIKLDAQPGDTIMGALVETDKREFDYFFYDEKRRLRFLAGEYPDSDEWGYDENTYKIDFDVPHTPRGPWYLVLDAKSKQIDREIEVILKRWKS